MFSDLVLSVGRVESIPMVYVVLIAEPGLGVLLLDSLKALLEYLSPAVHSTLFNSSVLKMVSEELVGEFESAQAD